MFIFYMVLIILMLISFIIAAIILDIKIGRKETEKYESTCYIITSIKPNNKTKKGKVNE